MMSDAQKKKRRLVKPDPKYCGLNVSKLVSRVGRVEVS